MIYVVIGLIGGTIAAVLAPRKKRDPVGWFVIGFLLPLIALILLLAVLPEGKPKDKTERVDATPRKPNPPAIQFLLKVDAGIGFLEHVAIAVFLAMLVCVASYTALARNLMDSSPSWGDELIRASVFFIAMTGAALAAQSKQLIRMDVLTRALSPRGRAVARICTAVFTMAICLVLAHAGQELRETALAGEKSTAEFVEPVTAALMIPLGFLLIAFHVGVQTIELIAILARGETPAEEAQSVH